MGAHCRGPVCAVCLPCQASLRVPRDLQRVARRSARQSRFYLYITR